MMASSHYHHRTPIPANTLSLTALVYITVWYAANTVDSTGSCTNITTIDPYTKRISIDGMVCDMDAIQDTHLQRMRYLSISCRSGPDGLTVGNYVRDYLEAPSFLQELKIEFCPKLQIHETDFDALISLRILSLQNSNYVELSPEAFKNLHDLELLKLRWVTLNTFPEALLYNINSSYLPPNITDGNVALFPRLKHLLMSHNQISTIPDNAFVNVPNLEQLDLCANHLTDLSAAAFQPLDKLLMLNISENRFTEIPRNFWASFPSLQHLVLSHSLIVSFDNQTFDGLTNLLKLEIDSGQFNLIEPGTFQGMPHVEEIAINAEFMTSVPDDLIRGMNSLRTIQLNGGFSPIALPLTTLFLNLPNLESVTARRNQITSIANLTFQGSRRHMKVFDFGNNQISSIPVDFFGREMPQVEIINLHENMLNIIESLTFSNLFSLQKLDLSGNYLTYTAAHSFSNLPRLQSLNLNQNNLFILRESCFYRVENLRLVDLSYNRFTNFQSLGVNRVAFANSNNDDIAATVIMTGNPLQCDCEMYKLLYPAYTGILGTNKVKSWPHSIVLANQHFKNYENLLCSTPIIVAHEYESCTWGLGGKCLKVVSLDRYDFFCRNNVNSSCPLPCQCYQQAATMANITLCDKKNLTRIPDGLPRDTNKLHLEFNHLRQLHPGDFDDLPNLVNLILTSNAISSLPPGLFRAMSRLEGLYLDSNTITHLPLDSFINLSNLKEIFLNDNKLSTIPDGIFDGMTSLTTVMFQRNPLQCNCSLLWLKPWLQEMSTNYTMEINNVNCSTPKNLTGSVAYFDNNDFMCPTPVTTITIIATCLAVLLILSILIIVSIRFKIELQVIVYSYFNFRFTLKKDDEEDDKIYDVFISYSSDDYQYVVFELLKKLEDHEPPYKVCIHQRDFLVGEAIANNIVNAIESCKRTLVVISNNYLESEWCLYEFKVAHSQFLREHKNRIVVVRMEEVDERAMDRDMHRFLSMNTYLERDDPLFWKRLLYALPNPRIVEKPAEINDPAVVEDMVEMQEEDVVEYNDGDLLVE